MYYDMNKRYPISEGAPIASNKLRWVVVMTVLTVSLCTASLIFMAYSHHLFGLGVHCPKKSMYFKPNSPRIDKVVWDYATFWSNKAKNEKSFTIFLDPHSENDPDELLFGLNQVFEPLSLRPCPTRCRKKVGQQSLRDRRIKTESQQFITYGEPFGGLPLKPLFEMDLKPEFRFRDHVQAEAEENFVVARTKMANGGYDTLVTIYLSTLTPEAETILSGNGSIDVRQSQSEMLQSAVNGYRNASKPLFLVLGNHSEAGALEGEDLLIQNYVPDNVALAIISFSDATIFNFGLWPAFGALLGFSNVTSFAMDKNLLESARNASFNWTTTIAY